MKSIDRLKWHQMMLFGFTSGTFYHVFVPTYFPHTFLHVGSDSASCPRTLQFDRFWSSLECEPAAASMLYICLDFSCGMKHGGQILIKLSLDPRMSSRHSCQLSNENSAYSECKKRKSRLLVGAIFARLA